MCAMHTRSGVSNFTRESQAIKTLSGPSPNQIRRLFRSLRITEPRILCNGMMPSGNSGISSPWISTWSPYLATIRWTTRLPDSGRMKATTSPTLGLRLFNGAMVITSPSWMNGDMLQPLALKRNSLPLDRTVCNRSNKASPDSGNSSTWVVKSCGDSKPCNLDHHFAFG